MHLRFFVFSSQKSINHFLALLTIYPLAREKIGIVFQHLKNTGSKLLSLGMTIAELEAWFKTVPMPEEPLYLNPATKVNDIEHFLESHFAPLRIDPNSKVNEPLLSRLKDLKLLIESNL